MSIEIIGAGFGRTGTMSTSVALNLLGYPCYHMTEVFKKENNDHIDFWNHVANSDEAKQHNWNEVFADYTATVDNPGCAVWKELLEAYPKAKVLMTLHPRGPKAWFESTIETIYASEYMWQFKIMNLIIPFRRKLSNMTHKLIWTRSHKGSMKDEKLAIQRYNEHLEEVKKSVPPERLLIFSVDQGWVPLCKFLDKEIPNIPFPRVNDRVEFKKRIAKIRYGAYLFLVLVVIIMIAIVQGIVFVLS